MLLSELQPTSWKSKVIYNDLNQSNWLFEKGKFEHLTRAKKTAKEDDPTFQGWDGENSIVIAWLINSMETEIGQKYLFLLTAKGVWGMLLKFTYSNLGNSTQIFEIKSKLWDTRQDSQSMTQYYNALKNLWHSNFVAD